MKHPDGHVDVVVDADVLGRQRTGDETYVRHLLTGLAALGSGLDIRAVARRAEVVPGGVLPEVLPVRSYAARLAWGMPRCLSRLAPSVAHFQYVIPPAYRGAAVVTVHDLSFLLMPELEDRVDGWVLRTLVPRSMRRAARVLTVSQWTKRDIVERYGIAPERIVVTPNGVDPAFSPGRRSTDRGSGSHHADRRYLLFVGALRPRKDPLGMLEAFALLPAELRLVMVGPDKGDLPKVRATIDRLGLAERVELRGHVEPAELVSLYRGAACVVLPSRYEGFGLPVLEAMACGAPVVTTTAGALPEVAGDAALVVPPGEPGALAEGVRRALFDREALIQRGLERARQFSWEETARLTLEVYREVIAYAAAS
ncbi:MAG TPA: glycosyltransferase family 1 protein [Acidimicrobiales bacterium]|nr:glycosyltransferase family 1 protein [Acidimicrobiales bacterium]